MTTPTDLPMSRGAHPAATLLALLLVAALAGFGPGCILPSFPPSEDLDDDDDASDDDASDDDASDDDVGDDDDDASDDDVGDDDVGDDDVGDDDVGDDDVGDDDMGDDDTGSTNPGQACGQAPVVTAGTYNGNTAGMADTYADPSACTGYSASGFDGCYSVHMLAGEYLTADLTYSGGAVDAAIYLSDDANAPDINCLAGADLEYPSGHEVMNFTAPANGLYYIVVDGYNPAVGEPYTLVLSW